MKYMIKFSKYALLDLDHVWDDVLAVSGNSAIAYKYIDDLLSQIEKKKDFPMSGSPLYYEDMFTGYHYFAFKAYLVFYRIDSETMLIDRVLCSRSDYLRVLGFGEDKE
ncbi:MAG: type II toxin-antitoxin system RelE/ParE family toxin [Clostridiales bacterium]|nr:type II toxin-antitoxin system RelE/ParE family toxin [Clostridiales bacterium]